MIRSVGIDIVDVSRIKKDVARFGERFVKRILGEKEIFILKTRIDKDSFLAGRLAAKEAVIKGLGTFIEKRPPFNVIQVINDATGQPKLELPVEIERKLGTAKCILSLTHERNFAAAVVIFTEEQ